MTSRSAKGYDDRVMPVAVELEEGESREGSSQHQQGQEKKRQKKQKRQKRQQQQKDLNDGGVVDFGDVGDFKHDGDGTGLEEGEMEVAAYEARVEKMLQGTIERLRARECAFAQEMERLQVVRQGVAESLALISAEASTVAQALALLAEEGVLRHFLALHCGCVSHAAIIACPLSCLLSLDHPESTSWPVSLATLRQLPSASPRPSSLLLPSFCLSYLTDKDDRERLSKLRNIYSSSTT